MNILFVLPAYLPAHRYGGPVTSVHELGRKLVEQGASVTVFTTCADGPDDLDVPLGGPVDYEGISVYYFPVEKPRSYFRSTQLAQSLRKHVAEFDVVHINWLYVHSTLVAARECHRQGVPYIVSPRGMLDKNAVSMKGSLKKNLYISLFEKKHLKDAATIHYTSYGERENAVGAGFNENGAVVYNGINAQQYASLPVAQDFTDAFPDTEGKKQVLFLGRLNYIKGLDLLAKAWPKVIQKVPDAHLVIAGPDDYGYGPQVSHWLKEGGCGKSFTFTGLLLGEQKLAALSRADVFVASSYLESFGLAIVEAMACAKPVVITDRVNICREVERAGAGLVTPCESDKIAEALVELLQNPQKAKLMGEKGKQLVISEFTWDKAAADILCLYRKVITKKL